ncbi:peroxiredoxin [Geobacter argillaceus]|uniref:Alkyl hydroperoxide reductase C n=1 Tax=Geobacter argillaceus TaxID=345631 RepID=A0A562VMM0_9BACT|nr:peroxiredoxin [Geobacter argillaceus]TWJ19233.1 alkyl hydroperoxide reductase subunit AhpC [Geobacter argillaceus]
MSLYGFRTHRLTALAMTLLLLASLSLSLPVEATETKTTREAPAIAKVGKPAPGFTLEGVIGTVPGKEFKTVNLADFRGKWLVFFFYPADFTFVCPTEIKGFNSALEKFKELGAEVIGASTDSKWSHLAWIKRGDLGDLKIPLLADFNKTTARNYGVLEDEAGVALRGLFIIDPNGILQYQVVHNLDVGRSVDETIRVLEALQTGSLCPLGWKPGEKTLDRK